MRILLNQKKLKNLKTASGNRTTFDYLPNESSHVTKYERGATLSL